MNLHLLLVTFSLRNPNKDYTPFFVALRGYSQNWWHYIEQTVIVAANYNAAAFNNFLIENIEETDSLLVVEINAANCQGWLPPFAWKWIQDVSLQVNQEQRLKAILAPPTKPNLLK